MIKGAELRRLAQELPNFEEITNLIAGNDVTQEDVFHLVRNCENLRKFRLIFTNIELLQNFPNEIDGMFDVDILWDAFEQKGVITIENEYNVKT